MSSSTIEEVHAFVLPSNNNLQFEDDFGLYKRKYLQPTLRYPNRKTGFGLELKFLKIMMMLGLEKPEPKREREKKISSLGC